MLRDMIAADILPDYHLEEIPGDKLRVRPRSGHVMPLDAPPALSDEVLQEARQLLPGQDVYALLAEWHEVWRRTGKQALRSPGKAFLGWLVKRAEQPDRK